MSKEKNILDSHEIGGHINSTKVNRSVFEKIGGLIHMSQEGLISETTDKIGSNDEQLNVFVESLQYYKHDLYEYVQDMLVKPGKTREELALWIYLDVVLKQDILRVAPFDSKDMLKEVHENRLPIAFMATEWIAVNWLREHPESQSAQVVSQANMFAPSIFHFALLKEMWPKIVLQMKAIS